MDKHFEKSFIKIRIKLLNLQSVKTFFLRFDLMTYFLTDMTQFQICLRFHDDKHFDKVCRLDKNCACQTVHIIFLRSDPMT